MEPAPLIYYHDLTEGLTRERDYVITQAVYEGFLSTFDDRSPLHMDAAYASACGFTGRVMHGGILNGFISHFIGMVFPGANSLLLSVELRFLHPMYLGDTLQLQAKIAQKVDTQQVIMLHLTFHNQTQGDTAATGRAQVKVRKS
jgi:3-hydroxybutyryl-CoA dehydratase